jgi:putative ABC transport system permease protein
VTAFAARALPGVTPAQLRDRIDGAIGKRHRVVVRDTAEVRTMSARAVDDGFAYATAMQTASLFVSLLALTAGVLANLLERRRELGVLRALGMSGRALAASITFEACVVGLGAAEAAVLLGGYLVRTWLGATLSREIGWPVLAHVPTGAAAATLAAGLVVGVLAGAFGARRTARLRPVVALRAA